MLGKLTAGQLTAAAAAAATLGTALLTLPTGHPTPAAPQPGPATSTGRPSPTAADTPATAPPAQRSPPPTAGARQPAHRPDPAAGPWRRVVEGFARDFTDPGAGHDDWLRRLSRWTSDYLAGQYRHTATRRIPTGQLARLEPVHVGPTAAVVRVHYHSGLTLLVRAETGPHGWAVTAADRHSAGLSHNAP